MKIYLYVLIIIFSCKFNIKFERKDVKSLKIQNSVNFIPELKSFFSLIRYSDSTISKVECLMTNRENFGSVLK